MHTSSPKPDRPRTRGWLLAVGLVVALGMISAVEVVRVQDNALASHSSELACLTRIIGELGNDSITMRDRPEAERILATLHREDLVRSAVFFDSSGAPFATYDRDGHLPARVPVRASLARSDLAGDYLTHVRGLEAGGLWIARDVSDIWTTRTNTTGILALAALAILALTTAWSRIRYKRSHLAMRAEEEQPDEQPAPTGESEPQVALSSEPLPQTAPGEESDEAPRGTVLIVEDDALNLRVTVALLERLGFQCEVAEHGEQALAILAKQQISAILMDCQMPVLDGWETTLRIRQNEAGGDRHVPIIAMTAGGNQADRDRCSNVGMDDFVPKPVKPQDLEETLRRWMCTAQEAPAPLSAGASS
ncbi:MAG TPA: response regulator [Planctomycetota bacterium]|nr:response regulator [Planctomycetota bacterium]